MLPVVLLWFKKMYYTSFINASLPAMALPPYVFLHYMLVMAFLICVISGAHASSPEPPTTTSDLHEFAEDLIDVHFDLADDEYDNIRNGNCNDNDDDDDTAGSVTEESCSDSEEKIAAKSTTTMITSESMSDIADQVASLIAQTAQNNTWSENNKVIVQTTVVQVPSNKAYNNETKLSLSCVEKLPKQLKNFPIIIATTDAKQDSRIQLEVVNNNKTSPEPLPATTFTMTKDIHNPPSLVETVPTISDQKKNHMIPSVEEIRYAVKARKMDPSVVVPIMADIANQYFLQKQETDDADDTPSTPSSSATLAADNEDIMWFTHGPILPLDEQSDEHDNNDISTQSAPTVAPVAAVDVDHTQPESPFTPHESSYSSTNCSSPLSPCTFDEDDDDNDNNTVSTLHQLQCPTHISHPLVKAPLFGHLQPFTSPNLFAAYTGAFRYNSFKVNV